MPGPVGAAGAIKAENVQSEYIALSGWVIPISKTMQAHGIDVQAAVAYTHLTLPTQS